MSVVDTQSVQRAPTTARRMAEAAMSLLASLNQRQRERLPDQAQTTCRSGFWFWPRACQRVHYQLLGLQTLGVGNRVLVRD